MNENDIKTQIQDAKKPSDTDKQKDADSASRIVERALKDAENGKTENINDLFYASVKKIRELSEPDFLQIKARFGKLQGFLASDLNKITKIYRKAPAGIGEDSEKQGRTSKADMLIELVRSKGTFFHNADNEAFISFTVTHIDKTTGEETGQHSENHLLRSQSFKDWASFLFYTNYSTTPGDSAINECIDTCSGVAQFEGEEIETCLRYGFHDNTIYIDLGREHWEVVEINAQGYKVIEGHTSPVKFTRPRTSRPLPLPEKGGNIALLWKHLNIELEDTRFLILAWLLEAMRVNKPYPVLEITGEQGTAKSTFSKRLREIIDPNKVDLRSAPRNVEDIFISTRNNHVICFNNLSHLTANTQDALCALSTGGGDATRKLYSNSEEEAYEAMRPIVINGISQLSTRPDLGDRTIAIELAKIKNYVTEGKLKESWEKDHPLIIGALYELLSKTLAELPKVKLEKPPRMADFTKLGQAMLNALGSDKSFTDIFILNRDRVVMRAIESSPVAQSIVKMIENDLTFKGTKGALMDRLANFQPEHFDRSTWPKSERGLGDALRRLSPALRVQGIEIIDDKKRYKDGYRVTIKKISTKPKPENKPITV